MFPVEEKDVAYAYGLPAGAAYFVPKPFIFDHAYTKAPDIPPVATAFPEGCISGLEYPAYDATVAGAAYFVPYDKVDSEN